MIIKVIKEIIEKLKTKESKEAEEIRESLTSGFLKIGLVVAIILILYLNSQLPLDIMIGVSLLLLLLVVSVPFILWVMIKLLYSQIEILEAGKEKPLGKYVIIIIIFIITFAFSSENTIAQSIFIALLVFLIIKWDEEFHERENVRVETQNLAIDKVIESLKLVETEEAKEKREEKRERRKRRKNLWR